MSVMAGKQRRRSQLRTASAPSALLSRRTDMRPRLKPVAEQVIVITGASSGNGLATAGDAVRRGAAVVLVARNKPALEHIAQEMRSAGGKVAVCAADVAERGSSDRIAATAIDAFVGFDT